MYSALVNNCTQKHFSLLLPEKSYIYQGRLDFPNLFCAVSGYPLSRAFARQVYIAKSLNTISQRYRGNNVYQPQVIRMILDQEPSFGIWIRATPFAPRRLIILIQLRVKTQQYLNS